MYLSCRLMGIMSPSRTFQYTFIFSACCCCALATGGTSGTTGTMPRIRDLITISHNVNILVLRSLGSAEGSSATSKSRKVSSVSSFRTPKSTQVIKAFSAALLSIFPTASMSSTIDQTAGMRKVSHGGSIANATAPTLLREELDEGCFQRRNGSLDGSIAQFQLQSHRTQLWEPLEPFVWFELTEPLSVFLL